MSVAGDRIGFEKVFAPNVVERPLPARSDRLQRAKRGPRTRGTLMTTRAPYRLFFFVVTALIFIGTETIFLGEGGIILTADGTHFDFYRRVDRQ